MHASNDPEVPVRQPSVTRQAADSSLREKAANRLRDRRHAGPDLMASPQDGLFDLPGWRGSSPSRLQPTQAVWVVAAGNRPIGRAGHCPPSASRVCPVTMWSRLEARKSVAAAISRSSPGDREPSRSEAPLLGLWVLYSS